MLIHFVAGLSIGMLLATLTITYVLCKEDKHGRK
ncbi:hypothetical protein [Mycolicibacterium phage J1]|nr:hypothetical protein [Mycolicibacterium phage J1]